jgi:hypothetical protein
MCAKRARRTSKNSFIVRSLNDGERKKLIKLLKRKGISEFYGNKISIFCWFFGEFPFNSHFIAVS